jgi:ATP-dependent DNA helicase RecG
LNKEKIPRKNMIDKIADGSVNIIIGTHALLQENIIFKKLGLAVIDEQHRFGVEQRAQLSAENNGLHPHLLSMTATPIPRTMAIVQYGDLDLSILNEMPRNRMPIKTYVVNRQKRPAAYDFVKKQIADGRQAFVICPLIDPSDKLGVKSVNEEYGKLKEKVFPQIEMAILHGKLKPPEKTETMNKFGNNEIKILVSTSVIEVGIDVPNATIMMVEGAERFGLAQLHQLRGRVGRGKHQSYCLLFPTEDATSRLKALETINDGFALAEIDLKLRGPGQVYGTEQSGKIEFKLADINNTSLLKLARDAANNLFSDDCDLKKYPHLLNFLKSKLRHVHLE